MVWCGGHGLDWKVLKGNVIYPLAVVFKLDIIYFSDKKI
jgi:hypothetical protein